MAVTFHRGHWCPYCRINTRALAEAQAKIAADGAQIVAIMPERQQFAAAFKHELEVHYPVLTDIDNGYALSLNLAIWVGAEVQRAEWRRPGRARLPGQRSLDAAAAGDLRRGRGGHRDGALHRSGLSQADGDRGSAWRCGSAQFRGPLAQLGVIAADWRLPIRTLGCY